MFRMFQMSWLTHSFSCGFATTAASSMPSMCCCCCCCGDVGVVPLTVVAVPSSVWPLSTAATYGSQSDKTLRIQCFLLTVLRVERVPKMLMALQKM
uniref:Putative secreted protein n=1 Tax=Anopheles darlingi TaxID=43151 RepID=A0A2M4DR68_ANODA